MKECPHPLTTASLPSIREASPRSTRAQIHMDMEIIRDTQAVKEANLHLEASLTMEEACGASCRVRCRRCRS